MIGPRRARALASRAREDWRLRYGWGRLLRRPVHHLRWTLAGPERIARVTDRRLGLREDDYWLFVLGATNSGTTIVTRFLASHPRVRSLPMEGQWLTNALPRAADYGVQRQWTERLDVFRWTEQNDAAPALRARYDWSFYYEPGPGILLEKSTPNTIRAPWLERNFRPSRFVGVVRHPYAVCEGIRRRVGISIEDAALQWARGNEIMLDDGERLEHFVLVRYEDVTERPDEQLARLQRFLELDIPFDQDVATEPIRLHNVSGRPQRLQNFNLQSLERLLPREIETIERIAGPLMERLEYAPLARTA
jgi:Sulfotransferase family